MTQAFMDSLMRRIVPILENDPELNVRLHEGSVMAEQIGVHYNENEFFYSSMAVKYVEVWKPHENILKRTRIEVSDLLDDPNLGQFILDQMRSILKEWLSAYSGENER